MSMNTPRIVALLPMKANSERVKGKNFREFCGKPLFKWILDTLLEVTEIDQVIINTDARNILIKNGLVENDRIVIRDRKSELCGDLVSMNSILADDVSNIDSDFYIMTHTTNPLLSATTIRKAIKLFLEERKSRIVDSLFTVNKIQTRFYLEDGSAVNHNPNNLIRTQDLEPWYEENSNLYLFTKESFKQAEARIGKYPMMYEGPQVESIDIDTQEDWDFAVIAARYLTENKGSL
ncbi:acylneuraminate cytidylyltransferase family protein [Amylibacter sp.]|nr:acylneuraminate cytidylyltransferase family protein [Amylibacter sp.]